MPSTAGVDVHHGSGTPPHRAASSWRTERAAAEPTQKRALRLPHLGVSATSRLDGAVRAAIAAQTAATKTTRRRRRRAWPVQTDVSTDAGVEVPPDGRRWVRRRGSTTGQLCSNALLHTQPRKIP